MEFRDKTQADDKPTVDKNGRRTYEFELLLSTPEEGALVDFALRSLAHNLVSNGGQGAGPINSVILLGYLIDRDENGDRVPIPSSYAGRFAGLLRVSAAETLGQAQGRQVMEMAAEIEQEVVTRKFLRQLDTVAVDDLPA